MEGYLVLEDGTSFSGELDGLDGCTGEVVFYGHDRLSGGFDRSFI